MNKIKYDEPLWDILMEMYSLEKVTKLTKNQTLTVLRRNTEERLNNERIAQEVAGFSNIAEKSQEGETSPPPVDKSAQT
tara:strand:+ start:220 stop:456 length:237 start_codon:yes stop_codon:yes gene_type:complete